MRVSRRDQVGIGQEGLLRSGMGDGDHAVHAPVAGAFGAPEALPGVRAVVVAARALEARLEQTGLDRVSAKSSVGVGSTTLSLQRPGAGRPRASPLCERKAIRLILESRGGQDGYRRCDASVMPEALTEECNNSILGAAGVAGEVAPAITAAPGTEPRPPERSGLAKSHRGRPTPYLPGGRARRSPGRWHDLCDHTVARAADGDAAIVGATAAHPRIR